jgi:hypothetical protein
VGGGGGHTSNQDRCLHRKTENGTDEEGAYIHEELACSKNEFSSAVLTVQLLFVLVDILCYLYKMLLLRHASVLQGHNQVHVFT